MKLFILCAITLASLYAVAVVVPAVSPTTLRPSSTQRVNADNLPTEQDARRALGSFVERIFDAPYLIGDFRKTNGANGEVGGTKTYELHYQATLEFPTGVVKQRNGEIGMIVAGRVMEVMGNLEFIMSYETLHGAGFRNGNGTVSYRNAPTSLIGHGAILFKETENGWVAYDGVALARW